MQMSRRAFTSVLGGAAAFQLNAQSSPNVIYDPVDFGSAAGYGATKAIATNGRDQITGNIENLTAQANEAFLWTPGGTDGASDNPQLRPLGNLSGRPGWIGNGSMASAVNHSGDVVGWADGANQLVDFTHACVWRPGGDVLDMGTLLAGNSMESRALGINNIGNAVGWSDTEFGTLVWFKRRRAFMYNISSRRMVDLGIEHSEANGLNDWNEIVGAYQPDEYTEHAVFWDQSGRAWDLHNIVSAGGRSSKATAINDRGQIVGWADDAEYGNHRGFFFDSRNNVVRHASVPSVFGTRQSKIFSINNQGKAVGLFRATMTGDRALFWDVENGRLENLSDCLPTDQQWPRSGLPEGPSVWSLWEAWSINDVGVIVGQGQHWTNGVARERSFWLTPRRA